MHVRAPAVVIAVKAHGETAAVARFFTARYGVVAAYVAGGRGRHMRPVLIPGNGVDLQLAVRSETQLPFASAELVTSRGVWMGEPLAAAAIGWICALTASVLPERHAYPPLYDALCGVLEAICHAPSARGWAVGLVAYETLLLRELGYGNTALPDSDLSDILAAMDRLAPALERYLLADRRGDVMAARTRLRELLGRMI